MTSLPLSIALLLAVALPAGAQVQTCPAGFRAIGNQCFKVCPEGKHAAAAGVDRCDKDVPLMVKRGFFGGCPGGYVNHPVDPKQCVLPAVADRMRR